MLERIFNSGTLVIESASEHGMLVVANVPNVEQVQREVYRLHDDDDAFRAARSELFEQQLRSGQTPEVLQADGGAGRQEGAGSTPLPPPLTRPLPPMSSSSRDRRRRPPARPDVLGRGSDPSAVSELHSITDSLIETVLERAADDEQGGSCAGRGDVAGGRPAVLAGDGVRGCGRLGRLHRT